MNNHVEPQLVHAEKSQEIEALTRAYRRRSIRAK